MEARNLLLLKRRERADMMRRAFVPIRVCCSCQYATFDEDRHLGKGQQTLLEIQLMILLCVPPFPSRQDLSMDLLSLPPLLLGPGQDVVGNRSLGIVVGKNPRAILSADISALTVQGGRVVHLEEKFDDGFIAELGGVVEQLDSFGV